MKHDEAAGSAAWIYLGMPADAADGSRLPVASAPSATRLLTAGSSPEKGAHSLRPYTLSLALGRGNMRGRGNGRAQRLAGRSNSLPSGPANTPSDSHNRENSMSPVAPNSAMPWWFPLPHHLSSSSSSSSRSDSSSSSNCNMNQNSLSNVYSGSSSSSGGGWVVVDEEVPAVASNSCALAVNSDRNPSCPAQPPHGIGAASEGEHGEHAPRDPQRPGPHAPPVALNPPSDVTGGEGPKTNGDLCDARPPTKRNRTHSPPPTSSVLPLPSSLRCGSINTNTYTNTNNNNDTLSESAEFACLLCRRKFPSAIHRQAYM
jgi:hypothetical protein